MQWLYKAIHGKFINFPFFKINSVDEIKIAFTFNQNSDLILFKGNVSNNIIRHKPNISKYIEIDAQIYVYGYYAQNVR